MDGANVEIAEEAGEECCFLFGYLTHQVEDVRYQNQYQPSPLEQRSPELAEAVKAIKGGMFGENIYDPFLHTIENVDFYIVANDFGSYLQAEELADTLYREDHSEWTRKALLTVARMGKFSSDRAVQEYADEVSQCGAVQTARAD